MCGLAGILAFEGNNEQIDAGLLEGMRDTMVHRGPDGVGLWVADNRKIGLAHRRLAIVDLSDTASQPMHSIDGRYTLVFNGEIYNHAELRKELFALGRKQWRTDHSDTEVLLQAFHEWGIDCLHKLKGMFAFAIWDASARVLWLARDRMGVKPLYYYVGNGKISFASEIKALLVDQRIERRINERSLYHFLGLLTTPAPDTLFEGVRKLPNATWMRINESGRIDQEKYWDPYASSSSPNRSESDLSEELLFRLEQAVEIRKVADVPTGVFLSGGVDSSANTALFSAGETTKVKTFSIGYEGNNKSYKNELEYARLMAETVHAEHHERHLNLDDALSFLPKMIQLQDEPIADPVCIPVYYVSKLARDNGVIVCQVGEGADESWFGYPGWMRVAKFQGIANKVPFPKLLGLGSLALQLSGRADSFHNERITRMSRSQPAFWSGAEAFPESIKSKLLGKSVKDRLGNISSWEIIEPTWKRFNEVTSDPSPLSWMGYADMNLRLPELLLMRVDKMSMGASIEARVPFLDHELIEFSMSIPSAQKVRNGITKQLLKTSLRGVIPDELIDRPKQGFGVPIAEWFNQKLGQLMHSELKRFCHESGLLEWQSVEHVLMHGEPQQSWYLFNLALWWRNYIANEDIRDAMVHAV